MKTFDNSMQDNDNMHNTQIKNSSFLLKIKYNQNHSVQGTIQWLENKKVIYFRSLMELVQLLHEATSTNIEFRSWNGENGLLQEIFPQDHPTGSDE